MCANQKQGEEKVDRVGLDRPPAWLLVLGEPVPRLDRKELDREALRFAVELHHDRALQPGDKKRAAGWCTGAKAFQCWVDWLQDERRDQVARTHANGKGFLVRNRRTAVRYLRAMQQRHAKPVADRLENAIRGYEEVIREAHALDTSAKAVSSSEGRAGLVAGIERIIGFETQAVAALDSAVEAMQ